mmetsp:Transcript_9366/g.14225  ORF Transcript_9366/g.14225 Transcript_9366/m.14225 type:complete len:136 (-) Transcript_9366:8-415(-)
MIIASEVDSLLYHLASLAALGGFTIYHCYFMGRETYDVVTTMSSNFEYLSSEEGVNIASQIGYNLLWTQGEILDNIRIIKYMIINHFDARTMNYDQQEVQQETYVLLKHVGKIIKLLFTRRLTTNVYNDFGDYPN